MRRTNEEVAEDISKALSKHIPSATPDRIRRVANAYVGKFGDVLFHADVNWLRTHYGTGHLWFDGGRGIKYRPSLGKRKPPKEHRRIWW